MSAGVGWRCSGSHPPSLHNFLRSYRVTSSRPSGPHRADIVLRRCSWLQSSLTRPTGPSVVGRWRRHHAPSRHNQGTPRGQSSMPSRWRLRLRSPRTLEACGHNVGWSRRLRSHGWLYRYRWRWLLSGIALPAWSACGRRCYVRFSGDADRWSRCAAGCLARQDKPPCIPCDTPGRCPLPVSVPKEEPRVADGDFRQRHGWLLRRLSPC